MVAWDCPGICTPSALWLSSVEDTDAALPLLVAEGQTHRVLAAVWRMNSWTVADLSHVLDMLNKRVT
jgi:hypothetical protein